MAYNMKPLVMECTYPFPNAGIPCPACGHIQKKPSLFNLHAKNVHHTLNTETPTTCSACGKLSRSYKAASAHYSRAHEPRKKPASPEPSPLVETPSTPANDSPRTDAIMDAITSSNPQDLADLLKSLAGSPAVTTPTPTARSSQHTPTKQSPAPSPSTQELIHHVLIHSPSQSPPSAPRSSGEPTSQVTTSSPRDLSPEVAPPIPIHQRSNPRLSPEIAIDDFLRQCRRKAPSSKNRSGPSNPSPSPPSAVTRQPSTTVNNMQANLNRLKASLAEISDCDEDDDVTQTQPPRPSPPPTPPTQGATSSPQAPADHPPHNQAPTSPHPDEPTHPAAPTDLDNSQDILLPENDRQLLQAFHDHWSHMLNQDLTWNEFSTQCELFADSAKTLAVQLNHHQPPTTKPTQVPVPRRPPNGRPVATFNPTEAKRIQGLYRHSKKRAARKILSASSTTYTGSCDDAHQFFTQIFAAKTCDVDKLNEALTSTVSPSTEDNSHLYDDVSPQEVSAKLRSSANTAPGPDRVEYRHLKRVDPQAKLLTLIYNRCLRQQDVPKPWKDALTVLIHKKGAADDVSNFRPIALMSCIYKLFMAVLGKRLTTWSINNGLLSDEQKSARPSEGCYEHTYLLQSIIGDARRNKRSVHIAWLDLRNAFGSIPHSTIQATLLHLGVPESLVTLVMNAYTEATTSVRTDHGTTEPIPIRAGVKQGCPMSPILFNLCLELVLRAIKQKAAHLTPGCVAHFNTKLSVLAYADDLVFLARTKKSLQALLDAASTSASTLGLEFRPSKCATLSFINVKHHAQRIESNTFLVQNGPIPALEEEESYRYLGIPIGMIHNINDIPSILPQLIQDLHAITNSLLAPWQKLDAIRTFLQPALTYALRAGYPTKDSLKPYRTALIAALRSICDLPPKNSQSYFFASKHAGGLAFQDPTKEDDVQAIVQAVRILSSTDPTVTSIACAELRSIVSRATSSNATPALISQFLSGSTSDRCEALNYAASSTWTRCRNACRRLKVSFHFSDTDPISISADDSAKIRSRMVTSFLHRLVQQRAADVLLSLRDQGKVAQCLATDQYANGTTWSHTGLNMRFKDWRFIHKARLNLLPTNVVKSKYRNSSTSPTCRHCHHPETLPHILCHCRPELVSIRNRHNKIVDRLTNAIRFGTITTDRAVASANSRLRPDIIVEEDDRVIIIDVTCPFDNGADALEEAANAKLTKYQCLKEHFTGTGKRCDILPFVIGALGSWYPPNEEVLRRLGMTRRYKSLFRKLCCSDVIQGSCDIFRLHMGWDIAA